MRVCVYLYLNWVNFVKATPYNNQVYNLAKIQPFLFNLFSNNVDIFILMHISSNSSFTCNLSTAFNTVMRFFRSWKFN